MQVGKGRLFRGRGRLIEANINYVTNGRTNGPTVSEHATLPFPIIKASPDRLALIKAHLLENYTKEEEVYYIGRGGTQIGSTFIIKLRLQANRSGANKSGAKKL